MDQEVTEKESDLSPEEQAMFPGKTIRLMNGESVVVKPWGMTLGMELSPRVMALIGTIDGDYDTASLAKLVRDAQEEVLDIVLKTIGWSHEDSKIEGKLAYEDLFTLAQAVMEVCIIRNRDLGGVLGKAAALGVMLFQQKKAEGDDSLSPSTSSSQTDTPGATSNITHPSL